MAFEDIRKSAHELRVRNLSSDLRINAEVQIDCSFKISTPL